MESPADFSLIRGWSFAGAKITVLPRYQQDLHPIRPLGPLAHRLDEIIYHRIGGKVRKDGTLSYQGQPYEARDEWVGHRVVLVVDPHEHQALAKSFTRSTLISTR